jgi:4'-phosphopantetheinyl transferase
VSSDTVNWSAPPNEANLRDDEVHLWRASLDLASADILRCLEVLSEDERDRAERFHFERDRRRFAAGRGTLRRILARYLAAPAESLTFACGPTGKPRLSGAFDSEAIHFNVTHSESLALFAVTRCGEVGVDVEQVREIADWEPVAVNSFTAEECAVLRAMPADRRWHAFFRNWTRKEAGLKAKGLGLGSAGVMANGGGTDSPPGLANATRDRQELQEPVIHSLVPQSGYVAALALFWRNCQVRYFTWAAGDRLQPASILG